jgi:hypothetical protein
MTRDKRKEATEGNHRFPSVPRGGEARAAGERRLLHGSRQRAVERSHNAPP